MILRPQITFKVTKKDQTDDRPNRFFFLRVLWPLVLYYISLAAATIFFLANWILGVYTAAAVVVGLTSIGWGIVIGFYIWPPVSTLLPRRECSQGWRVTWQISYESERFNVDSKNRLVRVMQRLFSGKPTAAGPSVDERDQVDIGNQSLSKIEAHFSPGNYQTESKATISPFEIAYDTSCPLREESGSQDLHSGGDSDSLNRQMSDFVSPFEEEMQGDQLMVRSHGRNI